MIRKIALTLFVCLSASVVKAGTITTSYSPLGSITISSATGNASGNTYTFFQQTSCNANTFTNACAFTGGNITAHSTLLVGCVINANFTGAMNVTDNNSNVYTPVNNSTYTANGNLVGLYYTLNANAGATTVTCKDTGSGATFDQVSILEYKTTSGGSYDTGSENGATGANPTCGNVTTTVNNEFVAAFAGNIGGSVTGQSGTLRVNFVNNSFVAEEDTTVASPSSYGSTFTAASGTYACIQAALK